MGKEFDAFKAASNPIDLQKANIQSTIDEIQELSMNIRSLFEATEDNVNVQKDNLKTILDGLDKLTEQSKKQLIVLDKQEKSSNFSLFYGALLGVLLGIVGIFFCSVLV